MKGTAAGCHLKPSKFWTILLVQTIFVLHLINAQGCEPPTKIECGQQGNRYYTSAKCVADERCCYNKNYNPSCYYGANVPLPGLQCMINPANRVDCGSSSTQPMECLAKGCCWNATLDKTKWCYYPLPTTTTTTTTTTTPPPPTPPPPTPPPPPPTTEEGPILELVPCKCSIQGDPYVTEFGGTRTSVKGEQTVTLYNNKERQLVVNATLGPGDGALRKVTVVKSVTLSLGGAGNVLVFKDGALQTAGDAPGYVVVQASQPMVIKLEDYDFVISYEDKTYWTFLEITVPYKNDEGLCGVCPIAAARV